MIISKFLLALLKDQKNCLIFATVILNAIPEIIESQYGNTNHKGPENGPITLVIESIIDG